MSRTAIMYHPFQDEFTVRRIIMHSDVAKAHYAEHVKESELRAIGDCDINEIVAKAQFFHGQFHELPIVQSNKAKTGYFRYMVI